ncbi:MAG: coproporphyrinogen dehydrogenase HemZ [Oscillospiraceae bacterium]|nr:coproporphyrinogen dehydrogenase HemZ [Oscillospiraceae bacterium]
MDLKLIGHEDRYAVEQLQMSLFPEGTGGQAVSALHRGDVWLTATAKITLDGRTVTASRRLKAAEETVRLRRRILQQSFYLAAVQLLPQIPAWGALAGVRPTKITTKHMLEGGSAASAGKLLKDVYYVTPERRTLAVDCSRSTVEAVGKLEPGDVSLYVGIPFCPTRCAYCSFVSRTVGKRTELMEPYLDALLKELELTGQLLESSGRKVRTLYIGGGTPTTLTTEQMIRLLDAIRERLDLSRCIEFTVEGGRPDTLDLEKLRAIRDHGADRMSINPQSMSDPVLKASGRPHRGEDVLRSYRQAVEAGFDAINMDLIAGLPSDTVEGFCRSLDQVIGLEPANITVHTLALKKGADLFERRVELPSAEDVAKMVAYANETLRKNGYKPYYLYRQKYMSGSFENVGWSREGLDCLYNIYMMEEVHTIISLGGGGMNKVNLPGGRLERFHNPKFPEQYIEMIGSVLEQKKELFRLMGRGDNAECTMHNA